MDTVLAFVADNSDLADLEEGYRAVFGNEGADKSGIVEVIGGGSKAFGEI